MYNYTLIYPLGSKAAGFLKAALYHQNIMADRLLPESQGKTTFSDEPITKEIRVLFVPVQQATFFNPSF